MFDSKSRFSSRVDNYVKYRPHYPDKLLDILGEECGLDPDWSIADIGSGTGISSELFVKNGNLVYGIEPNKEMRTAAESNLAMYENFVSINGSAEETTLDDSSVDMVTAGQAFHWFAPDESRREFARILKPGGWIVLFWNRRRFSGSPFMSAYEEFMCRFSADYLKVNHLNVDDTRIADFFSPGTFIHRTSQYVQVFDVEGLIGRTLSNSYIPEPGSDLYKPMIDALHQLFDDYQQDGVIRLEYDTDIYMGQITQSTS